MYRCTIRVSDRAGGTLEFGLKGAVEIKGSLAFFLRSGVPSGWHPPSMRMPRTALRVLHVRSSLRTLNQFNSLDCTLREWYRFCAAESEYSSCAKWALPSPALYPRSVDVAETLSVTADCSAGFGKECGVMEVRADLRWSCACQINVLASRVCEQSCEGRSLRDTLVRMTRSAAPIKLSENCLLWFCSVPSRINVAT